MLSGTFVSRFFKGLAILSMALAFSGTAHADAALVKESEAALQKLISEYPAAKKAHQSAAAVLVFPNVVKGGLIIGGSYGKGTMFKAGKADGHYETAAASYGFQAGASSYGYALFFMNSEALSYLDRSEGFEVGVGPSIVVADEGYAMRTSNATLTEDIVAFIFSQSGLFGGTGIEGSKITRMK